MVEASNSSTNADKDKTPIILAITIAAVLSLWKSMETNMKMLIAEKSIGHTLIPNTLTPYIQIASVVIDNNNLRIVAI